MRMPLSDRDQLLRVAHLAVSRCGCDEGEATLTGFALFPEGALKCTSLALSVRRARKCCGLERSRGASCAEGCDQTMTKL